MQLFGGVIKNISDVLTADLSSLVEFTHTHTHTHTYTHTKRDVLYQGKINKVEVKFTIVSFLNSDLSIIFIRAFTMFC